MSSHENGNGAGREGLESELRAWLEVANAFGSGQTIVVAAVQRMRAASTARERDSIRAEVRGFCRRLGLGMLALLDLPVDAPKPGPVTPKEDS